MDQDLSTLDVNNLYPLSPEVISRQATINIGMATGDCALLFGMPTSVSKWACFDISVAVLLSSCVSLPVVSKFVVTR